MEMQLHPGAAVGSAAVVEPGGYNGRFDVNENTPTDQLIAWTLERFAHQKMLMTTSFGMEGCALIDMYAKHGKPVTVVYLDTFSPGASPAAVNFGGDVDLAGTSTLVIELAGTALGSQYDTLAVSGDLTLGGALDVDLLDGFTPLPGSVFQIVSAAGGVGGSFENALLPALSGANWQMRYSVNAVLLQVALTGDYNFNGRVDAADYTLWRNSLGQIGIGLAADGDGDRQIDVDDYAVWKTHFGDAVGSGAGSSSGFSTHSDTAAPEPTSALLSLVSLLVLVAARSRRSSN